MNLRISQEAREYINSQGEAIMIYTGTLRSCCLARTAGPSQASTPPTVKLIKNLENQNVEGMEERDISGIRVFLKPGLSETALLDGKIELDSLLFFKNLNFNPDSSLN